MNPEDDEEYEDELEDDIGPFGTNGDNLEGLANRALSRLNRETAKNIDVNDYPELEELMMVLNDGTTAYGSQLSSRLAFQPSIINKFLKLGGRVPTHIARKLADATRSYLRSDKDWMERARLNQPRPDPSPPPETPPETPPEPQPFVLKATEWKLIVRTPELEEIVDELIRLLREVMGHATTSNLPPNERALTSAERSQLIAILETAIQVLKAPMVEKSLLKKAKEAMEKGALSAVEKGVEHAFSFSAGFAAGKLSDFLTHQF